MKAEVRAALDRAAAGVGRTPTTAHPDCTCVVQVPNLGGGTTGVVTPESRRGCSQHGPERKP